MTERNKLERAGHVVSPASAPKKRRQRNPENLELKHKRQRRDRLRRQAVELEKNGLDPVAVLTTHCLECSTPIKPSYKRGFCNGGECRAAWEERGRWTEAEKESAESGLRQAGVSKYARVIRIKQEISEPPTLSLLAVKVPARVIARDSSLGSRKQPPAGGLNLVHERRERSAAPLVAERTEPVTALSELFPFDEPLFLKQIEKFPTTIILPPSDTKISKPVEFQPITRELLAVPDEPLFSLTLLERHIVRHELARRASPKHQKTEAVWPLGFPQRIRREETDEEKRERAKRETPEERLEREARERAARTQKELERRFSARGASA